MATDVDVELINLDGYKWGTYEQAGIQCHSIKISAKPEFKFKAKNFQDVVYGLAIGPIEGSMDCSGDYQMDTPSGIALADFLTAFVPDFSTSFFGLSGGWYLDDIGLDLEASKLATGDFKFTCNKNVP